MRFDSVEQDGGGLPATHMYTIKEVPEEPVQDTRCCCLRWLGIGRAREGVEGSQGNSSVQRTNSDTMSGVPQKSTRDAYTASLTSTDIPNNFWWKYEMFQRMQSIKETWAVKMMQDINQIENTEAESYQKEIQFMVENFKNKQLARKNSEQSSVQINTVDETNTSGNNNANNISQKFDTN